MNDLLLNIKSKLIYIEKIFASFSLLALLTLSLAQVLMRNFLDLGFTEIETITRHLVLFVTFMGAALVSEGNKHIKIDCVTATISTRSKQKLKRPLFFISSIICFIFSWYATAFWIDEKIYAPDSEQLALYLALILPVGFSTLSIHFLLLSLIQNTHDELLTEDNI